MEATIALMVRSCMPEIDGGNRKGQAREYLLEKLPAAEERAAILGISGIATMEFSPDSLPTEELSEDLDRANLSWPSDIMDRSLPLPDIRDGLAISQDLRLNVREPRTSRCVTHCICDTYKYARLRGQSFGSAQLVHGDIAEGVASYPEASAEYAMKCFARFVQQCVQDPVLRNQMRSDERLGIYLANSDCPNSSIIIGGRDWGNRNGLELRWMSGHVGYPWVSSLGSLVKKS